MNRNRESAEILELMKVLQDDVRSYNGSQTPILSLNLFITTDTGVHERCTTFLYPELQICIAEKKTNAIYSSFRFNKKCAGREKILDIKVFS